MTLTQAQKILIVILTGQIALIMWFFWPEPEVAQGGQPLLADLPAMQVDRIEIEDGNGAVIGFNIDPTTNHWVHSPSGYAPTDGVLAGLIRQLEQVETGRLVTQTPASHARLQVADRQFNRRVRLWADGVKQELIIGSAPNSRSVHVRLPNQDEVWLTNAVSASDVDPALRNWLNTLYYSVERNEVLGITIENENGTLTFSQAEPAGEDENGNFVAATWQLEELSAGEQLDQAAFNTILSRATSMRFTEPLGFEQKPSYQLDDPLAVVTIELENESRTLTIGAFDEESDSYVVASDFSMLVRVPSLSVREFVTADPASLTR